MSECHFWWRAGDTQWCDMQGDECDCHGWEESCTLKRAKGEKDQAQMVAQVDPTQIREEERKRKHAA